MTVFRSFLFCPGNHPNKVRKAFGFDADAVILDLEDAVPAAEKVAARDSVIQALKADRSCGGYVRVNAHDAGFCYGDLVAVVGPWLDGVLLPKVEGAGQVRTVDWLLRNLERERELVPGRIDLIPIIETAKGLHSAYEVASAGTRVQRLAFGAIDLTFDLNLDYPLDEWTLGHARAALVQASRAADIEPPIDTAWPHIKDMENLEKSARLARQMGFQGKTCIYPPHVEVLNRTFTPTTDEVERARKILRKFEEAEKGGSASIQMDGFFIDYPTVHRARRTVRVAEAIRSRGE